MAKVLQKGRVIKDDTDYKKWCKEVRDYIKEKYQFTDDEQYDRFWNLQGTVDVCNPPSPEWCEKCVKCGAEAASKELERMGISERNMYEIEYEYWRYVDAHPAPPIIYETVWREVEKIEDGSEIEVPF